MAVRPVDELMELYQELTQPGHNYLYNVQQQQQQQRDNMGVRSNSGNSSHSRHSHNNNNTNNNNNNNNNNTNPAILRTGIINTPQPTTTTTTTTTTTPVHCVRSITPTSGYAESEKRPHRNKHTVRDEKSAEPERQISTGLVESRSGSVMRSTETLNIYKSQKGGGEQNPYIRLREMETAGDQTFENPLVPSRRTELLFSFLQREEEEQQIRKGGEIIKEEDEVRELFACWLCETVCAEMGWLNTPTLYQHNHHNHNNHNSYSYNGLHRSENRRKGEEEKEEYNNNNNNPFHHSTLPVTLLTLCSRCSAACSLPLTAPHTDVLRKAGATRALAQRTVAFITAVREYKQLLEVLAADVQNKTDTHYERNTHPITGIQIREDVGIIKRTTTSTKTTTSTTVLSFCDYPHTIQCKVIEKLIAMLKSTLELDVLASLGGRKQRKSPSRNNTSTLLPSSSSSSLELLLLSYHERDVLRCELTWLQQQLSYIPHDINAETSSKPLKNKDTRNHTNMHSRDVLESNPNRSNWSSSSNSESMNRKSTLNQTAIGGMETKVENSLPSRITKPKQQQQVQDPASVIVNIEKRGREALDRMMERALVARKHNEMRSNTTDFPSTKTRKEEEVKPIPTVSCPHDVDDILLHYFEGRLKDLPRFKVIPISTNTDGSIHTLHLEPPLCQDKRLQLPQSINRNNESNPNYSNITPVALAAAAADADIIDAAMNDTPALIARLKEEQQRRMEAEDALTKAHQKIADLEMTTDQMAESLLKLRFGMEHNLHAMQELMRAQTLVSAEFAMQKTLLFSDNVEAVLRRTLRDNYTKRGPLSHSLNGIPSSASSIKDNDVPIRLKDLYQGKNALPTPKTISTVNSNVPSEKEGPSHISSDATGTPATPSLSTVSFPVSLNLLPLAGDASSAKQQKKK